MKNVPRAKIVQNSAVFGWLNRESCLILVGSVILKDSVSFLKKGGKRDFN